MTFRVVSFTCYLRKSYTPNQKESEIQSLNFEQSVLQPDPPSNGRMGNDPPCCNLLSLYAHQVSMHQTPGQP